MDVNGDGLPDKLWHELGVVSALFDSTDTSKTMVSYNLGNGKWTAPDTLDIGRFNFSASFNESLNLGFTYGFTVFGAYKVTLGLSGCPYSGSVTRDYSQFVDVNADGLPDLVKSTDEGEMTVRYQHGGMTNLLKSVTNFTGSGFSIDYELSRPSYEQPSRCWLMARVTTDDPLDPNGGQTTITDYTYANPHYDRYERTSYGYGSVTTRHINPSNNSVYRTIERNYDNRSMMRRGKLTREMTADSNGNPYVEKIVSNRFIDYGSGVNVGDRDCPVMAYTAEEAMLTNYYEGDTIPWLTTGEKFEYDRYHNIVRYIDLGDTADHSDGLVVEFDYFTGLANNLIGLRKDYTITPTGSAIPLRRARFEYDFVHGKLTRQVLYNEPDSSVYDFFYEPIYGNLDTARQPVNINGERMTYHYDYDNTVHTYPTQISNSYGESASMSYDFRFGKPLAVTDPTGSTMTYRYDFAGRLVSVTSPLNTSGTPSLVNEYHPVNYYRNGFSPQGFSYNESPTHHPYAVSLHYDDNGSLITATAVLTNGFGRAIQTKKGLRVGGANMMQVSGRTVVDAFGRTVEQYDPAGNLLTETNPLGQISYGYTYYRPLYKRYSYMTGNNVTYTYGTSGTSKGRPVRITDGTGSLKLAYDALGNVTMETRVLVLPNSHEEFRVTMKYGYDSWGRMLPMIYPDAEEVYYSYQWGGDLNAMHGEKNGILRTYIREIVYNSFGQKENVRYGNGTRAYYTYDALHRLAKLQSIDSLGNYMQDIAYTFDRASNVTGITNNAGAVNTLGGTYGNTYAYDALHRLVGSSGSGTGEYYDMAMTYLPSGRIRRKNRYCQSSSVSGSANMYYGYCDEFQPHAVRRIYDEYSQMHYDLRWDAAGNLGQISIGNAESMFESGRFLFWTEDNRMHVAVDNSHYSYYAYDHSGERRIKLTGENSVLDVNAEIMSTLSTLDKVTLYPSAYVVLTDRGYTKHYYTGMERIAARIGDGGLNVGIYLSDTDSLHARADRLFGQSLDQVNCRVLDANEMGCILDGAQDHVELGILVEEIPERMLATVGTEYGEFISAMHLISGIGESSDVYFYHSDHLGSASWITDSSGIPVQHLQYMPFGEPFVNQRISGYNERFTFTGKERDEETGFGYFGARYMDHELMTMWLIVDPMADKYPSVSPYAYCAWNPVRLVDPDGKEIVNDWVRRADGTIYWDPNAKSPASTKKGETYLGKKGATYDRQTNEVTLYRENGTTSKFQSSGPMTEGNYTYPIDIKSDTYNNSRSNPSALYGSRRDERKHAGCDLYAPEGTAVFSITKGTVMSVGSFYKGTDEIAINHNSFIGRYCELIPSFDIKPGCKVNSGDFLGVIVSMSIKNGGNNSMLHFEMYLGNASGKLTNRNNPPFKRRSDLKNPTMFLNNLIAKTWSF